ncbi:MAG: hypothetical protein WBC68_16135 [Albidovulum sp.]
MRALIVSVVAFAAMLAVPAALGAEVWQPMTGAEIEDALTDRTLIYDDEARQTFRKSGGTTYQAGAGVSEGRWLVMGDQYCSIWPPSAHQSCYAFEREAESGRFRFRSKRGDVTAGRYATD